jgi:hypothetical protein
MSPKQAILVACIMVLAKLGPKTWLDEAANMFVTAAPAALPQASEVVLLA